MAPGRTKNNATTTFSKHHQCREIYTTTIRGGQKSRTNVSDLTIAENPLQVVECAEHQTGSQSHTTSSKEPQEPYPSEKQHSYGDGHLEMHLEHNCSVFEIKTNAAVPHKTCKHR